MQQDLPDPPPKLDVENFLLYRLSMLSRKLSDAMEAYYGPRHGLQRAQWRMLMLIGSEPRCTASTLVRRASLDAVAVHRAVGQLIHAGLVIRSPSATDGRAKLLRLSARGQRVHDETVPVALTFERRVLSELSPAQARFLLEALDRLESVSWVADADGCDAHVKDGRIDPAMQPNGGPRAASRARTRARLRG